MKEIPENAALTKKIYRIDVALKERDITSLKLVNKVKDCERNALQNEKNHAKKKNILERLVDLEKSNADEGMIINVLTSRCEKLEENE